MKTHILHRIAAILAFIIGGMAVFAGTKVVVLHIPVDYYVIDWLPVYNLLMGLVTVFITAVLLWKDSRWGFVLAVLTLLAHATVLVVLRTAYREVVAPDSIRAMTIRIVTWIIIVALLAVRPRRESNASGAA